MESFWDFAKLALIVGAVLIGLVLILLALLGSRLRKVFAAIFFSIAGILGIYIVSPLDFIPLLGQLDALLATVLAVVNGIAGIILYLNSRSSPVELGDRNKTDFSIRR